MKARFLFAGVATLFFLLLAGGAQAGAYEELEAALIRGDTPTVLSLIDRGIELNSVNRQGDTLLMQAVRHDQLELFEQLLKRRARINTHNRNGETALSLAAFLGRTAYVKRLVEAGAELNFFGWPPLAYAAYNGHKEIVDYLIEHGAEVNGKTDNGSTALFFAARFGHLSIVRTLLAQGADPTVINQHDETAVDWAIKGRNTEIEAVLRSAGGRSGKSVTLEMGR